MTENEDRVRALSWLDARLLELDPDVEELFAEVGAILRDAGREPPPFPRRRPNPAPAERRWPPPRRLRGRRPPPGPVTQRSPPGPV
ncbi:hypothetical protein [Nocardia kruczakiae]|uniref:hypothetical protein n=1 Tax=Nocardia kruczakiae TaxID=261477 RepID=UPI0012EE28FD|nr:hypothetical protein [Nocardia kruczakiae]